jgi:hypothetical protein
MATDCIDEVKESMMYGITRVRQRKHYFPPNRQLDDSLFKVIQVAFFPAHCLKILHNFQSAAKEIDICLWNAKVRQVFTQQVAARGG